MHLNQIITQRGYQAWPSWDLVYEWEDILKSELQLDFYFDSKFMNNKYVKRIPILGNMYQTNQNAFMFEMSAMRVNDRNNRPNITPCIIDFFLRNKEQLQNFYKHYDRHYFVLVSSKEVYEFLKSVDCPLNIEHLPLSISDKYKITSDTVIEKKYDLVLTGRLNGNSIFLDFTKRYAETHPDFRYVFRKQANPTSTVFPYFTSDGEELGDICTREKYVQLIRSSKVGLYTTPGLDGGEKRTNGFNQVTPRFLEYIAAQCHVMARYPHNADTDFYELPRFCKSVETYDEFCYLMDYYRREPVDTNIYSQYLERHYTSKRAEQLSEIIKKY